MYTPINVDDGRPFNNKIVLFDSQLQNLAMEDNMNE